MSEGLPPEARDVTTLISNHIVKVTRDYTGRGPTRARTYLHDDLVTVVLRETLTRGERSLVNDGRRDEVMRMRLAFQGTMKDAYVGGVEEILGRKVLAFLSANHFDPDMAIESFVLAPDGA